MVNVLPTPDRIVDSDGLPRCGVFDTPFREVDLHAARPRLGGRPLPAALARLNLKQWQHVGFVHPELFVGLALVDLGYLRTVWCHVVDRRTGEQFEHTRKSPLLGLDLARTLWDDRCQLRTRGFVADIDNRLEHGEHRVKATVAGSRRGKAVRIDARCLHGEHIEPLVVVMPVGDGRGAYSHKSALPTEGVITVGDEVFTLDPAHTSGIWDVHKAHYPRQMFWNWATFAGWDTQGRHIALNLTRNVNPDDEAINENVIWVDGRRHHLAAAGFEFDPARPADPGSPWRLSTTDGAVDLTFRPEGERSEDLRLGLVESVFRQPYGTFSGTVMAGAEPIEIVEMFGVCEDHHAVW